jgi:nucleoside-diphosphate-sugar epimerase
LAEARSISGEIFNVGSANRIRIIDLAHKIIEMTGSRSEIEFVPYDEVYGHGIEDMLHRIPAVEKIKAAVGWEPSIDLHRILSDVLEDLRRRGDAQPVQGQEALVL